MAGIVCIKIVKGYLIMLVHLMLVPARSFDMQIIVVYMA